MIISHRHKFIFLKTSKTAGTSVEIALSKFCGPDDVITPITDEDEAVRRGLGYRGPQNFRAPISAYGMKGLARIVLRGKRALKGQFYNHMPAELVRKRLDKDIWDNYFKFCIERNPYDRCVSSYFWTHQREPRPPFVKHVNLHAQLLKENGYYLYTIDDQVVVDKICRYESLADELEAVRQRIGLPDSLQLPTAKSRFRKDKSHYRDIIDAESRVKIAALFSEEMKLLGYEW